MMIKTKSIPEAISSDMYREVQGKILGNFFQKSFMKKSFFMGLQVMKPIETQKVMLTTKNLFAFATNVKQPKQSRESLDPIMWKPAGCRISPPSPAL